MRYAPFGYATHFTKVEGGIWLPWRSRQPSPTELQSHDRKQVRIAGVWLHSIRFTRMPDISIEEDIWDAVSEYWDSINGWRDNPGDVLERIRLMTVFDAIVETILKEDQ